MLQFASVSYSLRPFALSDFDALYALDRDCYPRGIAYSRRELHWYLSQPGAIRFVAEAESKLSGFILADADPPRGHIITIDVAEEHRRHGVGTLLLDAAERVLADCGVHTVEIETATDNQAGLQFWYVHKYQFVGRLPGYYLGRIDAIRMEKALSQMRGT
ncbi:MAG: GNAT family N-acetyltransferase [Candidatus Acidiferrales bacterium]